jgi:glycosyltransferase involved in cell wall biosynthesis
MAPLSVSYWLRGLSYSLVPFSDRALRRSVAGVIASRAWKAVVVDGLHAAAALPDDMKLPIVYRAHNVESEILERAATANGGIRGGLLNGQARRLAAFEDRILARADLTCAVSEDDAARLRARVPSARVEVVPIGWDFPLEPPLPRFTKEDETMRLLFVGRLDWAPNREGLERFLAVTWPRIQNEFPKRFELFVVGSGDGSWLSTYRDLPGVKLWGRVDSLEKLYLEADACLVPLPYGSGIRVKAIEASRYARPCVATPVGLEGLGLSPESDCFLAESESEWIATFAGLSREESVARGKNAFRRLRKSFSAEATGRRFRELLAGLGEGARS